jgi:ricin-type beta-trefoil lectin protein
MSPSKLLFLAAGAAFVLIRPGPAEAATTVVAQHSGLCLDVRGGPQATGNGAPLEQWNCTGASNQSWTLNDAGAGFYELVAGNSGKCAEAAGGGTANGTAIQQASCTRQPQQLWRLRALSGGAFEIVNVPSSRCLDITGGPQATDPGALAELWNCTGAANQAWALAAPSAAAGLIVAKHSCKCLDVVGGPGATGSGAAIEQWKCTGATNQSWTIVSAPAGRVQLRALNSGHCVAAGGTANGAAIQQLACAQTDQQQLWTVQNAGSVPGEYRFVNAASGRCLDITGGPGGVASGALAELWDCTGAANQTWTVRGGAPLTARDPLKWPFAADSIWNMPIGSGAAFVASGLTGSPGTLQEPDHPDADWATMPHIDPERIILKPTAPLTPIRRGDAWGGDRCNSTSEVTAGLPIDVPIPANYLVPSDNNNDGAAILLGDGHTIVQVQPFTRCTAGGPATALLRYPREPMDPPSVDLFTDGRLGMHGGSGLSTLGGTIRLGELRPGGQAPRHALKMNVYSGEVLFECRTITPMASANCRRWPAEKADSSALNDGDVTDEDTTPGYGTLTHNRNTAMKMGALLALPPSVNIASLGLETDPGRQVAWTLQNYGVYIVDSFGGPNTGFAAEDGADGSKLAEFQCDYGYEMGQRVRNDNPWMRDIRKLMPLLQVVNNNGPSSIGGGGTPRQPLAPPFQ